MLPKTINLNESTIVNVQDYFSGTGTYWVCVYNDLRSSTLQTKKMFTMTHKFKILVQFYVVTLHLLCLPTKQQSKTRVSLLDFYEKPSLFNDMFIKHFPNFI